MELADVDLKFDDATDSEKAFASRLVALGQGHLFAGGGSKTLLAQLSMLDANYPGGLDAYTATAKTLLSQSARGENPLAGWRPSVPDDGFDLAPGSEDYGRYEERGLEEAAGLAFVVPAGGLGERLGFSGVKFELPSEVSTGDCVLQVYANYILAVQRLATERDPKAARRAALRLPLAIMTSDDTDAPIRKLLEARSHFGLEKSQVTILKQEKVAALADSEARFALGADGASVLTKPHGHGDVHYLLHSTGTAKRWAAEGRKWVMFFQDTNTLYFSTFLATLGVSAAHNVAVNLVTVPRRAKEAIGAVAALTHDDGRRMVANVEYNQLEPLLHASGHADGDVNEADGYSKYPGNINELMFDLQAYTATLEQTNGRIDEFINPKYADASRTTFKSPTRLECMMQDYVKTTPPGQKVAWTRYPNTFGYYPAKNDIVSAAKLSAQGVPPHSASSSEFAVYEMHATSLRLLGAAVAPPTRRTFRGVGVDAGPAVVLAADFAPCLSLLRAKLPTPKDISVTARSTLVVRGAAVEIHSLELDGALVIEVADGASLVINSLAVKNDGWEFRELSDDEQAREEEATAIRGYRLVRHDAKYLKVAAGEHIVVDEGKAKRASLSQIKTGRTTKEGLTISTGAELKTGKGVKEVPKAEGCCAVS